MKRFGLPSIHVNITAFVLLGLSFTWPRHFAQETISGGAQKTSSCGMTAVAGTDCQCEKKCPNDPDCKCCPNQKTSEVKPASGKKSHKDNRHSEKQSKGKDKKSTKDQKSL